MGQKILPPRGVELWGRVLPPRGSDTFEIKDASIIVVMADCCVYLCWCNYQNESGLCQITHGPVYVVQLAGQIAIPALQMSFSQYDFGSCFVYQAGMSVNTAQLKLTNADDKDLMYAYVQPHVTDVAFQCTAKSSVIISVLNCVTQSYRTQVRRTAAYRRVCTDLHCDFPLFVYN